MTDDTLDLFATQPEPEITPKMLRRNEHPETSDLSAKAIIKALPALYTEVLAAVAKWPGSTANELALNANQRDVRRYGRRLPELLKAGHIRAGEIRACRVTGRMAQTWVRVTP